jgi:RNA recognition motif-containing protein
MLQKIYVGNMPFSMTEDGLQKLFSEHGEVDSVAVIIDRDTGRPRGFGFVEMRTGAQEAIRTLNNHEVDGRALKVNEARPRQESGSRPSRW